MKFITISSALAAVLGLALACAPVTAQAQSTNAPASTTASTSTGTTTAPATAKKTEYKGTITAIDASSVTVKTAKTSLTLAINADTKFEFGTSKKNTPATAGDFAVNDKITGSYLKGADGSMTAVTVRKKQAAASK